MHSSSSSDDLRRGVPAWLMSLAIHAMMLSIVGFTLRFTPRGVALEPDRNVGIVLVHQQEERREYFDGDSLDAQQEPSETVSSQPATQPTREAVEAVDLAGVMPALDEPLLGQDASPDAGQMTSGSQSGRVGGQGSAQTEVFGITGTGSRFLYVFDRSGSMEGYGGRPLAAAKAELLASLDDLEDTHQFQIIFYNESPNLFRTGDGTPRLIYADANGKRLAQKFVRGISANGGTRHMSALRLALGMDPDVLFFLTDAAEPQLTPDQLNRVHRMNRGAAIHCIEFGFGPQLRRDNFLVRLAQQNGGEHAYVDISRLGRPRGP